MNYSDQLKSILKASGWSQEELARRLDVSFVTLNAWVNARSEPRKKAGDSIRILYLEIIGSDSTDLDLLDQQKKRALQLKMTVRQIVANQEILDKLTLYLTYHTNTIEGSTMTLSDTEEVLFRHKTLANRTQIEQMEARNHQAALLWLLEQLQDKTFTVTKELIKGLHLRLMNGIISDAGEYRRHSVRIMGAQVTVANYLKVPVLVDELVANTDQTSEDPLALLSVTHATFEKIHPFSDGSGRVGRLLMLAQALNANLTPPLVQKERKQAYYKYLELAQTKEDFVPLELFMTESVIAAYGLLFE